MPFCHTYQPLAATSMTATRIPIAAGSTLNELPERFEEGRDAAAAIAAAARLAPAARDDPCDVDAEFAAVIEF